MCHPGLAMRDREMTTEAASEEQWSVGHPGLAAGDSWGDCEDHFLEQNQFAEQELLHS